MVATTTCVCSKSLFPPFLTLSLPKGALVEPVTKDDYFRRSGRPRRFPPSLFAHNIMQRHMHNLHAQVTFAKGVLGRTVNALSAQDTPYKSELFSLVGNIKMLEGATPPVTVDAVNGIERFAQFANFSRPLKNFTGSHSETWMGDTFSAILNNALNKSEGIGGLLDNTNTTVQPDPFGTSTFGRQMRRVAQLIKMRNTLDLERAVFVVNRGGWDTHNVRGRRVAFVCGGFVPCSPYRL